MSKPDAEFEEECVARGRRFTVIREAAGLNKQEFAEQLHLTPAYISFLEKGMKAGKPIIPTDIVIQHTCHRFGVSFSWLKDGKGFMQAGKRSKLLGLIWAVPEEHLDAAIESLEQIIQGKHKSLQSS